jgi:hypothetical protein
MSAAQAECEELTNWILPFAKDMLDRHGKFYPFGGAIRANGELISVTEYTGEDHPQSTDLIQALKAAFAQAAKKRQFKATALVCNVRGRLPSNGEKSFAIAISLNHRDKYSAIFIFPYYFSNGTTIIGSPFIKNGEGDIF